MEIEHIVGVVLDAPARQITDVYHDAKRMLTAGEQVLVILIDGLGYHNFKYAAGRGYAPFLAGLTEPEMAMSVYPAITNVSFAASVTGELPYINGVTERGIRRAQAPTIFAYLLEQEKKATAVLGDIQPIDLEMEPVLCADIDNDGSTDDEKQDAAMVKAGEGYDFLMVHYKDADIAGHEYGPRAAETLRSIAKIDGYIQQLLKNWQGKVLIYSDHGMHETADGGDHRYVIFEDFFVPYWLFDNSP